MLGGITLVIFQGINLLLRVFNPELQTHISVVYKREPLEFPAVTICNANKYRTSYLNKHPKVKRMLLNLWKLDENLNPITQVNTTGLENMNYTQELQAAAHQAEDMILYCAFQGQVSCANMFHQVFTDFGVCYTFNGDLDAIQTVEEPGMGYGLILVLNAQEDDYFFGEGTYGASGFRVSSCFWSTV